MAFRSALCVLGLLPAVLGAQPSRSADGVEEVFAASELEEYVRTLHSLGLAGVRVPHPWSIRPFSPGELAVLGPRDAAAHPWSGRRDLGAWPARGAAVRWLRPRVAARYNSTFPWGLNDGAVWAGRGVTTWASAGFAARWGPASLVVYPVAFAAQNGEFALMPNGRPGRLQYGDGRFSTVVDYPQRFGDRRYARLDPGESTLRVDVAGAAVGASTAHAWWGPAQRFPFLLGTNAAGFPHVFIGTGRPVDLGVLRAHGRALWGRLDQSDYFEAESDVRAIVRPRRFAAGLALVVQPRGLEELELGVARFIHAPWPDDGLPGRYFARPLEGIFKRTLPRVASPIPTDDRSRDGENGLASVFARLVLPSAGFEVYAEFGREDHPWDGRALMLTPDEQSAFTFGFARAWRARDGRHITRLRGEAIDFRQAQVDRARGGRPIYLHGAGSNQGHTQRGQLLGAGVGVSSAAGSFLALDRLRPDGRWSVEWTRIVRQDRESPNPTASADVRAMDVVHSVGAERLLLARGLELLGGVTTSYNFNRDFGRDRLNVSVHLAVARGVRP